MAVVYVNDRPVDIGGERLNVIQAAERGGVFVPHYCWHPSLSVVASCRMCLVEVGERKPDGTIAMQPKVVPGCQTPVKDGTVIVTGEYGKVTLPVAGDRLNYPESYGEPGKRARAAQADTLEGLLINHPLDCPVCDKAGECKLQDYSFGYGKSESRMVDEKNTPPNKPDIHKDGKVVLFTDRCIMCSRCVRFTREVSGTSELQIIGRGSGEEIGVFPTKKLGTDNKLTGNVVDLCPVGALGSKDFLYKQRVWFLKTTDSVCPGCSTGCSIHVDANKDIVFRLRPRENPQAQGHFMCDDGRWGYHYVNAAERNTRPFVKRDGELKAASYAEAVAYVKREMEAAASQNAAGVIVALSPFLTVEEAFLAASYAKSLSPAVRLALAPVPIIGADDRYPKNYKGESVEPVKFTIRAEKCPNRRGVEAVLRHFAGGVVPLASLGDSWVEALLFVGGYPNADMLAEGEIGAFTKVSKLFVVDLFRSPLARAAAAVVPAGTFAEKDGTYVNHAGLAQVVSRAVKSPGEARAEGQFLADLAGRRGLYSAAAVRAEAAAAVPALAKLAGDVPPLGIKLDA